MTADSPTAVVAPRRLAQILGPPHLDAHAVVALAVGGAVVGVATKIVDQVGTPLMAAIGSGVGIWMVVIALIARWSSSPVQAAVRATSFMVSMSLGYYVWSLGVLGIGRAGFVVLWLFLSVSFVPGAAALLQRGLASRGWWPAVSVAVAAALVVTQLGVVATGGSGLDDVLVLGHLRMLLVADAAMIVALLALPRHAQTRWRALLVLPGVAVAVVSVAGLVSNSLLSLV